MTADVGPGRAERMRFWRSPAGQPWWARPALLGIAALAGLLYAWRIRDSGYAEFYSVAVKSMSVSWKAFWYGAFDPGATITIDKLAGSFVPQALSARLFGYHAWSLTLPQVLEGVVAVLVMYRIGRVWLGPAAGLLAAGLFGLTPVVASMFGHAMEDGLLTMCLVLAADALQRALRQGRLRSLVLAGLWVGVGFQAKMLQAWLVLPAMALTYLVAAPGPLRRRLGQLAVAGAAALALSLSWVALFAATPASHRPYVDGSTDNSIVAMVFGYNGLDRMGLHVPGAAQPVAGAGGGSRTSDGPAQTAPGSANGGWTKLAGAHYASQAGWLYPLAIGGLLIGLLAGRGRPRTDPVRAGFLLWGGWLATFAVIYSVIMIPHTAYLASLAPAVAALAAGGLVGARRSERWWLLPAVVAVELAWTLYLASRFPDFLPWLPWTVGALGLLAAAAALLARPSGRAAGPVPAGALALAVTAMFATPVAWAASVLDPDYAGSASEASAGPAGPADQRRAGGSDGPGTGGPSFSGPRVQPPGQTQPGPGPGPGGGGGGGGGAGGPGAGGPGAGGPAAGPPAGSGGTLEESQRRIYAYLRANRGGARYLAAANSWTLVAQYITATGEPFLPMGGFTGSVPQPTLPAVQSMVRDGRLRFVLLGPSGPPGTGPGAGAEPSSIAGWVRSACAPVPPALYDGGEPDAGPGGGPTLFRCNPG